MKIPPNVSNFVLLVCKVKQVTLVLSFEKRLMFFLRENEHLFHPSEGES